MDSREYLSQIVRLKREIRNAKIEAEQYRRLSASVPGPSLDEPIGGSGGNGGEASFTRWINKAVDKEAEIERLTEKLSEVTGDIVDSIDLIGDPDARILLKLRFVEGMLIGEIAPRMSVAVSTVKRWLAKVPECVEVPDKYKGL